MNFCARRPRVIDHLFLISDFRRVPRRNFLQFFPLLVRHCFRCRNFHSLRHRNKFVNQVVVLYWIFSFSSNMDFMMMRYRISHTHSRGFMSCQNTRKFCLNSVGNTIPTILHNFTGHSKSDWCFQFLTRVLDGFFEFFVLRVRSMKEIPRNFRQCHVFQSSGQRWSGLDVICFLVSLPPDHENASGGFSSNRLNCVKPVQGSGKSQDPSIFQ